MDEIGPIISSAETVQDGIEEDSSQNKPTQQKPKSKHHKIIILGVAMVSAAFLAAIIVGIVFISHKVDFIAASKAKTADSSEQTELDSASAETGAKTQTETNSNLPVMDENQAHTFAPINANDDKASISKLAIILAPLSSDNKIGCILGINKDDVIVNNPATYGLTPAVPMIWLNHSSEHSAFFSIGNFTYSLSILPNALGANDDGQKVIDTQGNWSLTSGKSSDTTSFMAYRSVDPAHKSNLWVQLVGGLYSGLSLENAKSSFAQLVQTFNVYYYTSNDQIMNPIDSNTGKVASLSDYHFYNDLMSKIFRSAGVNAWSPASLTGFENDEGVVYLYRYKNKSVTYGFSLGAGMQMPEAVEGRTSSFNYHGKEVIMWDTDAGSGTYYLYFIPCDKGLVVVKQTIDDYNTSKDYTLKQAQEQFLKDLSW